MSYRIQLEHITVEQLPAAASAILSYAESHSDVKVFAFNWQMGAGKTTLIKELCQQLGSHDNFSSPSYSIVNEYTIEGSNQKIYHIDLYRLKSIEEAIAIGIEEYLNSENYCFIEWPGLIEPILSAETVSIAIEGAENERKIAIFMR